MIYKSVNYNLEDRNYDVEIGDDINTSDISKKRETKVYIYQHNIIYVKEIIYS